MRVREALSLAAQRLESASPTPRLDAELLMAHALGVTREELLLRHLDTPAPVAIAPLVERRLAHEPIAYMTGARDFWTVRLAVTPAVLIPRADSETLLEAAVGHFGGRDPQRILDLGTGSGALLLAALAQWPDATGVGIDASHEALAVAQRNVVALGFAARAELRHSDWGGAVDARYDLILCNPPYVEADADLPREVAAHEPHDALFAGADGLVCYRTLAPQLARLLAPGGIACVEIGSTQAVAVRALFEDAGFRVAVVRDLGGNDRCLTCRL